MKGSVQVPGCNSVGIAAPRPHLLACSTADLDPTKVLQVGLGRVLTKPMKSSNTGFVPSHGVGRPPVTRHAWVMPSSTWPLAAIWPLTSTSCFGLVYGMRKLGTVLVRATSTSTPRATSSAIGAALALPEAGPLCFQGPQSAQSVPRSQNTCAAAVRVGARRA